MVVSYLILLGLLAVQRLVELGVSKRNAVWAFARGGRESGARHYGLIKLLHTAFFFGCAAEVVWLERSFSPILAGIMLSLVLLSQALRLWSMLTLGPYWNTRVITIPGVPAIVRGPYRFLRHPNYVAVVIEGFAVPLIHGAVVTATAFSLLNALLLRVRIRCEEEALCADNQYSERLGRLPRFSPVLSLERS